MPRTKASVTVDDQLLAQLDELVSNDVFESRSAAVETALRQLLNRQVATRFEQELARLDPAEERAWAELGMEDYGALVERAS